MNTVLLLPQSSDPERGTAPMHRLCDRVHVGYLMGSPLTKHKGWSNSFCLKRKRGTKASQKRWHLNQASKDKVEKTVGTEKGEVVWEAGIRKVRQEGEELP